MPLQSLDHLFTLSFREQMAAPRAYWLPQPFVTSLLLVVAPSPGMWNRVERHFGTAYENKHYDMDIINLEFGEETFYLPDEYACLNSEWEDVERPFHFGDPEDSYERIQVVHFTALGKPWWYHPDTVRRLRPRAHPIFYDLWERWWLLREQLIEEQPAIARLRLSSLRHTGQTGN